MKGPRLIPVVMFAGVCLFSLKLVGLLDGGFMSAVASAQTAAEAPASTVEPDLASNQAPDQGGESQTRRLTADEVPGLPEGTLPPDQGGYVTTGMVAPRADAPADRQSPAEALLAARLGERRQELDAREAALADKEALLGAAEKRIEDRIAQLKALEAEIAGLLEERDEKKKAQVAGLVTMYENMKAKDAARIFDRLQLEVLLSVVEEMKPRTMSAILAEMKPETAERLTMAIARRNAQEPAREVGVSATELPKIDG